MSDKIVIKVFRAIAYLLCFGAFLMLVHSSVDIFQSYQTKGWTVVEGKLQSSSIKAYEKPRSSEDYVIELIYQYEVEGKLFTNDQLQIGGFSTKSFKEAEYTLEEIRKQQPLTVYINPSNFKESLIRKGVRKSNIVYLFLSIALTILFAVILFLFKKGVSPWIVD